MEIDRQHMFEELLDATVDGIFQMDTQERFLYVNRAFSSFVGLEGEDIIGRTSDELTLSTPLQFEVAHVVQEEKPVFREVDIQTPRGVRRFEYTLSPIYGNDGAVKALVGILHDIEERSQLERQKDRFFGLASHELRTPLAAIKGNVQLALRQVKRLMKIDAPGVSDFANKIEGMLTRAEHQIDVEARMVNDMLYVSRIQNNKLEIHPHPFDIIELVGSVIANERVVEQGRVIRPKIPSQESITVFADAERVEQVLTNYLSNAFKYAPPEQPIDVAVETEGENVRVSVSDKGPGLTPEDQQRIWDRFYQTPDRTVLNGQSTGLGLGLYICKTLIQQQQGTVGVESEKGHGSTFWFTLPLASFVEA